MSNKYVLPLRYDALQQWQRREVREQYIVEQNGLCSHCKVDVFDQPSGEMLGKTINRNLFPEGFFNHPIHLHHDHNTGMTLGAVHARCNAVLWQYHGE